MRENGEMDILITHKRRLRTSLFLMIVSLGRLLLAAGHGPVFGLATPTLGKRAWSLDMAIMGRYSTSATGSMLRSMLSYGLTEDLQISFSAPVILRSTALAPARLTSMMPANRNYEGLLVWRFDRQGVRVGARRESTAYLGVTMPEKSRVGTLKTAPGIHGALATGYASRSHYLWAGAGYTRYAARDGDRQSDLFFYSLVWGYRPPFLQKDYPEPDWRVFLELVGERIGKSRKAGVELAETGGHQIFVGPTTLGIYRNIAIEGGVLFPLYRNLRGNSPKEKFRFAINLSYFF
jgi:hypothetical protein